LCNSVHEEARAADRPPIMGFSVHIDVWKCTTSRYISDFWKISNPSQLPSETEKKPMSAK
jgi:hypothetical protein